MRRSVLVIALVLVVALTPAGTVGQEPFVAEVTESAKLTPSDLSRFDPAAFEPFGVSVDIDGDRAVVGVRGDVLEPGRVWVFGFDGEGWVESAVLLGIGGDGFGSAVSLWGERLAVGAPGAGGVSVYRWADGVWGEEAVVSGGDGFGSAVSLWGERLAVGAPGAGGVSVYRWADGVWGEEAVVSGGDGFGSAVSLWGERLAVGAPGAGGVSVYRWADGVWGEEAVVSGGDGFGSAVSLWGERLIVGAPGTDAASPGAAHVYVADGVGWTEEADLAALLPEVPAAFGAGVALEGDRAVVSGAFWFQRSVGGWSVAGEAGGLSGDVALSGDLLITGGDVTDLGLHGEAQLFRLVTPATVVGRVWHDLDGNGIQDEGEPGVPGVEVSLSSGGSPVSGLETDEAGGYVFESVVPGVYQVGFGIDLEMWAFTTQDIGEDDTVDSDPDQETGITAPFAVESGGEGVHDAGLVTEYSRRAGRRRPAARAGHQLRPRWVLETTLGVGGRTVEFPPNSGFGRSVALWGDRALIGSWFEGAAYVFEFDGAAWTETAKIVPPDSQVVTGVALWGDRALIADYSVRRVYVYEFDGSGWSPAGELALEIPVSTFGWALDLEADRAVVGSPVAQRAHVFEMTDSGWVATAELEFVPRQGVNSGESFGWSVGLSGARVVVGAPSGNCNTLPRNGCVVSFDRGESGWTESGRIASPPYSSVFGWSVAVDGDRVLIGDIGNQLEVPVGGAVHLYERDPEAWIPAATLRKPSPEQGDRFGWAVSLSGPVALVTWKGPDSRGAATVFRSTDSGWIRSAVLTASDGVAGDQFGTDHVNGALHGGRVLMGAWLDDYAGSAYVFDLKPVAVAGAPAVVDVGVPFDLDGSQSFGYDEDAPLTFTWRVLSAPPGSSATLSDPAAASPSFTSDVVGQYVFELVVNEGSESSDPATVAVTAINRPPEAAAALQALVGHPFALDGTGSTDVNGDDLSFQWELTDAPPDSTAALWDADVPISMFVPDVAGTYVFELTVHDGTVAGTPVQVTVEGVEVPLNPVVELTELIATVGDLGLNRGTQQSLITKLEHARDAAVAGDDAAALARLRSFESEVEALRGRQLDDAAADALLTEAGWIALVFG